MFCCRHGHRGSSVVRGQDRKDTSVDPDIPIRTTQAQTRVSSSQLSSKSAIVNPKTKLLQARVHVSFPEPKNTIRSKL